MKKSAAVFWLSLVMAGLMALAGCNGPFSLNHPAGQASPAGTGTVSISIGGNYGGRTAFPTPAFDRYEFVFAKDGSPPNPPISKAPNEDLSVPLAYGTWTVSVTAYKGTGAAEKASATGTAEPFVIKDGNSVPVIITLQGIYTGTGSFKLDLTYPADATPSIYLRSAPGGAAIADVDLIAGINPVTTGSIKRLEKTYTGIPGGSHWLDISLVRTGERARGGEQVEIHQGNTTEYTRAFGLDEFFAYDDGGSGEPVTGSISLDQTTAYTFTAANYGYATAPAARTVTVTNTGSAKTVTLTPSAADFVVTPASLNLSANGQATFTVAPKTGLTPNLDGSNKTYTATITAGGTGIESKSFAVNFTVNNTSAAWVDNTTEGFRNTYVRTTDTYGGYGTHTIMGYYQGTDRVMRVVPAGSKPYSWGFINYRLYDTNNPTGQNLKNQNITVEMAMKVWVVGTGNTTIGWTVPISNDTANNLTGDAFFSTPVADGQWVPISGTKTFTVNNGGTNNQNIGIVGNDALNGTTSLVGKTFYIADFYIKITYNGRDYTQGTPPSTPVPASISLDQTALHTFPAATAGYAAQAPKTVTVTNTGDARTVTLGLSGTNASSFTLNTPSLSLAANSSNTFTVSPATGLAAGTYTAAVTASAAGVDSKSFNVSFTVNPAVVATAEKHLYIGFGQSNMVGAGEVQAQDSTPEPDHRFQVMSTRTGNFGSHATYSSLPNLPQQRTRGTWYDAISPLIDITGATSGGNTHPVGLSPLDNFGRTLTRNTPSNITIGVIGVAQGSTALSEFQKTAGRQNDWSEYTNLYAAIVNNAKTAQQQGWVLKGIIVHQGESGPSGTSWGTTLKGIYDNILSDLGLPANSVPIIAGQLLNGGDNGGVLANDASIQSAMGFNKAFVVSSAGLQARQNNAYNQTPQYDNLHFGIQANRDLGQRYAEKMIEQVYSSAQPPAGGSITFDWDGQGSVLSVSQSAVSVQKGQTVTLTLSGSNSSIQWYRNGLAISGATASSYVVDTASLAAGTYKFKVIATPAGGTMKSSPEISVTVTN